MKNKTKAHLDKKVFLTLLIFLIVRFLFSIYPALDNKLPGTDLDMYRVWTDLLARYGLSQFYETATAFPYPPLLNYYLYFLGIIHKFLFNSLPLTHDLFTFLFKLPNSIGDIGSAYLIYKFISPKVSPKYAYFILLTYLLQPASFFISAIWGQTDGLLTFILLLSIYCVYNKKIYLSILFYSLALLTKPQAIALLLPLMFYYFRLFPFRKVIQSFILAVMIVFFICLPFFPKDPFLGIIKFYLGTQSSFFPHFTSSGFNFWYLIYGGWKDTFPQLLSFSTQKWSIFLVFLCNLWGIYLIFKYKNSFSLLSALIIAGFGFFLFFAPIKERYLYLTIPLLAISCGFLKSKIFLIIYLLVSLCLFLNSYTFYDGWLHHGLWNSSYLSGFYLDKLISLSYLVCFFFILLELNKRNHTAIRNL